MKSALDSAFEANRKKQPFFDDQQNRFGILIEAKEKRVKLSAINDAVQQFFDQFATPLSQLRDESVDQTISMKLKDPNNEILQLLDLVRKSYGDYFQLCAKKIRIEHDTELYLRDTLFHGFEAQVWFDLKSDVRA